MASTIAYPVLYLSDDMTEDELAETREEFRAARLGSLGQHGYYSRHFDGTPCNNGRCDQVHRFTRIS